MSDRWPALMDLQTAAEYLSISKRNLDAIIASQSLVPRRISERRIGLLRSDLDEFIETLPKHKTSAQRAELRPRLASTKRN